jgi:hypothetical protein
MNRERVWKPSKKYEEAYGFDDFFEGNSLMFHGHEFILQHCDEYTRKLVEGIERRAMQETFPISETQNRPLKDFAKKLLAANAKTFFQFAKILDKERKGAISLEDMFSTLQSLSVQCTKAVSTSFLFKLFCFCLHVFQKELESIVFAYDVTGDGTIQYTDLMKAMESARLIDASGAVISANM